MSEFSPPFGERLLSEADKDIEAALIQKIIDANEMMMKDSHGQIDRAQHPKGHGLLEATFKVHGDLPDRYRVGLFAKSRSFPAQIRFSNGGSYDDSKPDAHGMAIKLTDVQGAKLLPSMQDQETADFVLVDSEVFFEGDLDDYAEFNDFVAEIFSFDRNRTHAIEGIAKFIFVRTKSFLNKKIGIGAPSLVSEFADQPPILPLHSTYWSATPYKFGPDMAVKYEVVPEHAQQNPDVLTAPDGIAEALQAALETGPARFAFNILIQPDWETHPADDPTISWLGDEMRKPAQRVTLATIEIPQLNADALAQTKPHARAAKFNPWNTRAEHEPLGAINRARRLVYETLAAKRGN